MAANRRPPLLHGPDAFQASSHGLGEIGLLDLIQIGYFVFQALHKRLVLPGQLERLLCRVEPSQPAVLIATQQIGEPEVGLRFGPLGPWKRRILFHGAVQQIETLLNAPLLQLPRAQRGGRRQGNPQIAIAGQRHESAGCGGGLPELEDRLGFGQSEASGGEGIARRRTRPASAPLGPPGARHVKVASGQCRSTRRISSVAEGIVAPGPTWFEAGDTIPKPT